MSKETGCTGGMGQTHYDLLRYVADHSYCTNKQVMEVHGSDPRGYLRKLRSEGLIGNKHSGGINSYWIEPKGVRLLNTIDAGMGDIAAPRTHVSTQPYTGERWVTRPGSEPHAGYRVPMIIASNVLPSKGLGA